MRRAGFIAAVAGLLAGCLSSPPETSDGSSIADAGPSLVEEMDVPAACAILTSQKPLAEGITHHLRVGGVISLGPEAEADAEYFWFLATPETILDDSSGVEIGLAIDDIITDETRTPDWGTYRSDHRYAVEFIGQGAPINIQFHDTGCGDNTGSLHLAIFGPPE